MYARAEGIASYCRMIRNLILVLTSLCVGALLSGLYFSSGLPFRNSQKGELTADRLREALHHVSLQVPANLFATGDRVVAAEDNGEKMVELVSTNGNRSILLVKAQISFGVAVDGSPGLTVETDEERKTARITLPSPNFLGIADSPGEVAFAMGPVDQGEIEQLKNEAIASLHREANSHRYTEAAKAYCAAQLTAAAAAFGYTAEIIWTAPAPHHQTRTPL